MLRSATIRVGLMLLAMGAPLNAQIRGTSPDLEWEALLRGAETEMAALPVVQAESTRQVVSFGMDAGMLTAQTLLSKSAFRDVRVENSGLQGFIRVKQFVPVAANGPSPGFQFIQQDLTNRAAGYANTMISMAAGRLIVSRDVENGLTLRSIQLLIDPPQRPGAEPDEYPVRLLVNQTSLDASTRELKIQCSARSFVELRFLYRGEVDTYLRPIIRSFGQEHIAFAVPKQIAWQVLGHDEPVDPAAVARVQMLVAQFGDNDFRRRQDAAVELKRMGQTAIWVLGSMDRNKLTLQQSAEVDSLLASSAPLPSASFRGLADDRHFLLDVLYSDDSSLRSSALKRLSAQTGKPVSLDPAIDADQRIEAVSVLRAQLAPTTQPLSK